MASHTRVRVSVRVRVSFGVKIDLMTDIWLAGDREIARAASKMASPARSLPGSSPRKPLRRARWQGRRDREGGRTGQAAVTPGKMARPACWRRRSLGDGDRSCWARWRDRRRRRRGRRAWGKVASPRAQKSVLVVGRFPSIYGGREGEMARPERKMEGARSCWGEKVEPSWRKVVHHFRWF